MIRICFVSLLIFASLVLPPSIYGASIRLISVDAVPGGTIRVPVVIAENQVDLAGVNARLAYDSDILEIVAVEPGPLLSESHAIPFHSPAPGRFNIVAYDSLVATTMTMKTGAVLTLVVQVSPDAVVGNTYDISFNGEGVPYLPASGLSDSTGKSQPHSLSIGRIHIVDSVLPVVPVISDLPDESIVEGQSYTGPVPTLVEGTVDIWTLETPTPAPEGMAIDPDTGVVTWDVPKRTMSPLMIIVRATNMSNGLSDDVQWSLTITEDERPAPANYKVTYNKCALAVDADFNVSLNNTEPKSTIKIKRLKNLPKNMSEKPGVAYLLGCRAVPVLSIDNDFSQLYTDCLIQSLSAGGAVKKITAKNYGVSSIECEGVYSVKLCATAELYKTSGVTIQTNGLSYSNAVVSISGLVLEGLETEQTIKTLRVSSKKYANPEGKGKLLNLAGVGPVGRVLAEANGGNNIPVNGDSIITGNVKVLKANGCPITPDILELSGADKTNVSAVSMTFSLTSGKVTPNANLTVRQMSGDFGKIAVKGKKIPLQEKRSVKFGMAGGRLGWLGVPSTMEIKSLRDVTSIFSTQVISVIISVITDDVQNPRWGNIRKITTGKGGVLDGEAHVAEDSIKFKPKEHLDHPDFSVIIHN